ncbi:MAG TPA: MDR family MFS transporter [Caulobacteraceae bacterium]|nr:MDR family MFS transporter [Caulobacteraceae bacterium]
MTTVEHTGQTFSADERRITIIGVLIVFLLSALDQTIVSTAMPRIVAQLQGLNLYAWVTTAYMLSSTVMVPIYGKLGDIYGRKAVLITGIMIFLAGSMLCGLAGEFGALPVLGGGMTQLIVFRGLQGVGGGGLFTSAFAIIADLYPPRERAKFSGLFGAVFGLASVVGPVLGGFFTDLGVTHLGSATIAGWRWIFYVNIPVGMLALFMIIARMPHFTHRNPGKIDFLGAALIVVTFVPLLLGLSWGGRNYGWGSPQILGLMAVSAVGLIAFLAVEARVSNPIVSVSLFKNRVFSTANAASFVTSMAFMGSVTFLPLYMQLGLGLNATDSGLSILPMMVGMIASSTVCGQLITRTGAYKPFMLGGSVMLILGLFLISLAGPHTGRLDMAWRVLIMGIGLGPSMSIFNIAVQNAVPRGQMGVATSSSQFFRQIGGTVGIALFGAVMTHNLATEAAKLPAHPGAQVHVIDLSDLQRMALGSAADGPSTSVAHAAATATTPEVRAVVVHAISGMFVLAVGVAMTAFLLILRIPVLPLEHRGRGPAASAEPMPTVPEPEV